MIVKIPKEDSTGNMTKFTFLLFIIIFYLASNAFAQKPKWIYQTPFSANKTFYYNVGFGEAESENGAKINAMADAIWKAAQARGIEIDMNDLKQEITKQGIHFYGGSSVISIPTKLSCTYSKKIGHLWKAWVLCQIAKPGYSNPNYKPFRKCNIGHINNSGAFFRSAIIPGWGQKYKGHDGAAIWIFTSEIAALTVAAISYGKTYKLKNDIRNAGTTDVYDLTLKYDKWKNVNNISLAIAAVIYGINLTTAITMRDFTGTSSYSFYPSIDHKGHGYANLIIKF